MDTANYVIAARSGDQRAFTALVVAHQNLALGFAYSKLGEALDSKLLSKEHYDTAKEVLNALRFTHDLLLDPVYLEYVALGAKQKAGDRRASFVNTKLGELETGARKKLKRGLLLERFFTQPFFVTEEFSRKPGVYVSLPETISGCKKILAGEYDECDLDHMSYIGNLDLPKSTNEK